VGTLAEQGGGAAKHAGEERNQTAVTDRQSQANLRKPNTRSLPFRCSN